jgi:hypothetical protein
MATTYSENGMYVYAVSGYTVQPAGATATFTLGAFETGNDTNGSIDITASEPVLYKGVTDIHDDSFGGVTNTYEGTVTITTTGNGAETVTGFVVYDTAGEGNGSYYVFLPSKLTGTLPTGTQTVHLSQGLNDKAADNWALGSPGHAVCFMAGTAIATPSGEVVVEALKAGDLVSLSDGRVAPISWLGIQTVSTIFTDKLRTSPIRIKAGALAEGLPARDLLISPDHAILLDGALVHAGALVNGATITRETDTPAVFTYYHVEVADHSLVLAEGVAAETFIDNVDRMAFDNWADHEALNEGVAIQEMDYPRAKSARQVPMATRERLAARAVELTGETLAEVPVAA